MVKSCKASKYRRQAVHCTTHSDLSVNGVPHDTQGSWRCYPSSQCSYASPPTHTPGSATQLTWNCLDHRTLSTHQGNLGNAHQRHASRDPDIMALGLTISSELSIVPPAADAVLLMEGKGLSTSEQQAQSEVPGQCWGREEEEEVAVQQGPWGVRRCAPSAHTQCLRKTVSR